MPLIDVADLSVRFGTGEKSIHAVNGVSFSLGSGETLGIVGESGSGKSVTSLAIMGLLPKRGVTVDARHVAFNGVDLLSLAESRFRQLRGKELAMIFQDPLSSLNPVLSIGEQVTEVLRAHRRINKVDATARAAELLEMVGIASPVQQLKRYPHQFSGGMRQRVMVAIALALEPKLLIADEPTTALDVTTQAQVLELLQRLIAERHTALILISHDLGVVAGLTGRVVVMYAGFVVESADTADIFARPAHPYTVGLLNSIPRLDSSRAIPLQGIAGLPPDPSHGRRGCPFAPRCPRRSEQCLTENPLLSFVGPTIPGKSRQPHLVACWHPIDRDGRSHDLNLSARS